VRGVQAFLAVEQERMMETRPIDEKGKREGVRCRRLRARGNKEQRMRKRWTRIKRAEEVRDDVWEKEEKVRKDSTPMNRVLLEGRPYRGDFVPRDRAVEVGRVQRL
jgi:hypothetical protein